MTQSAENDVVQMPLADLLPAENWNPNTATPDCDWCGECEWCDNLGRVSPPEVTHCANCGAKVPVDRPHKVGECVFPPVKGES